MFMYIYVDIIGFFQPGVIEDILVGKVWVFEITQTWMLLSVMLMTIPALMVYLSLALPAKANRYANIGLGAFHIFIAFGTRCGRDPGLLHIRFRRGSRPSLPDRMDRVEVAQGPKAHCGWELK